MKIIESRSWSIEESCFYCTSKLLVEGADIRFNPYVSNSSESRYFVYCPVCHEFPKIKENLLPPKIVSAAKKILGDITQSNPQRINNLKGLSHHEINELWTSHMRKELLDPKAL